MFDLVVLGAPTVLRWRGQRVNLRSMERMVILALVCGRGHLLWDPDFAPRYDLLDEALPYMDAYPDTEVLSGGP
jgi:hypothetical protein